MAASGEVLAAEAGAPALGAEAAVGGPARQGGVRQALSWWLSVGRQALSYWLSVGRQALSYWLSVGRQALSYWSYWLSESLDAKIRPTNQRLTNNDYFASSDPTMANI